MLVATPGLDDAGGTIRLTNKWGAVLLEVEYSDEAPWPKQADGAGHSLVLVRPSYGENDPRAWAASDLRGGSPGKGEIYESEVARSVVINEFLANPTSGNFDFIELYNHGNSSVNIGLYNPSAAIPPTEDIVINEIMYNPISGSDADEFIEFYNKGASSVTLTGWTVRSVGYTFPAISIGAGAYLVLAKNVANLRTKYLNLTTANSVGDYPGTLKNSGERIALVNEGTGLVVDEVTYSDGGRWGQWSGGGGSSLELIDPRSDNRLVSNWADSDDSAEAQWTTVNFTGLLDNGMVGVSASALEVVLEGPGECLIDDVQVLDNAGGQRISTANSNFESGIGGWVMQGNHRNSYLDTTTGYNNSTKCLRLRASGRGDTGPNRAWVLLTSALTTGLNATIQAKVKWVRGSSRILFRIHGNWLEAEVLMNVPTTLGTPGAQNSRYLANEGPAIFEVSHAPVLPPVNQPVVVSARIHDPDGVASPTLFYRDESVAPPGSFTSVAMADTGAGGDAIQNDVVYSATIPGPATSKTYGFYILASDGFVPSATTTFPSDAPTRECLVRFGETPGATSFPTYRIWMTQSTFNIWADSLNTLNNPKQGTPGHHVRL